MHHYFEAITNNKGDALTGYYVRLLDSGGSGVTLYADTSLTPIVSVSGVADAAKVDANGNVDFYVAVGTYTLNIYATDSTTLVATIRDVGMNIDMDTAATAVAAQAAASASATAAASSAATALASYQSIASTANATAHAATRVALDLLPSTVGPVWLREEGFQGMWEYKTGNYAARVTADTLGGIFRALPDVATSAGARVRAFSGPVNVRWFGAVADCSSYGAGTDNSPAINGAKAVAKLLGNGAAVIVPKALLGYRCASAINFTENVQLLGQGFGQNSGTIGGTTYSAPNNYRGSVLVFDSDVAGFIFTGYTDHAANAPVAQYESSAFSVVRDLHLLSAGGVGITGHGVDLHTPVRFDNVRITGFAGNGLNIVCNTAGATQYGNADESTFNNVFVDANKLHGVLISGNDANNITFGPTCKFTNNGGCGSLDFTAVGGNLFLGTQYATNNQSIANDGVSLRAGWSAAQRTQVLADAPCLSDQFTGSAIQYRGPVYDNTDSGNASAYVCVYVETGQGAKARLRDNTTVIGGFLSQSAYRHTDYTAQGICADGSQRGIRDFYGTTTGQINFYDASFNIIRSSGSTIPKLTITPSGATYSQFAMQGASGSATQGLDVLAGGQSAFFSADNIILRNAAQTTVFLTALNTGVLASVPLGYKTGAGGAVTQATSRTTGVTLNTVCGQITLFSAAGSASWQTFTVTNSKVAATDVIRLSQSSGTDLYMIHVTNVAAGSFKVSFATTGGTTTEAPVFNFAVIKAVNA